ncbi:phosphoheptose isomerase [Pedobacter sp. SYSU D00535]|uniref:phosphoheptose isomerase n=1 Tax=Pedobacter sp. SYSU D00535 TaxID=2810308 RepID=UPI001A97314C|nr:phosphoheptose isomerase [Pedobacter sp. SYSU D00535]
MVENIFTEVETMLKGHSLGIKESDKTRPWGGFFVIREDQAEDFARIFFDAVDVSDLRISGKLSPKILIVAPGKRLSWQYHLRRAEIWKVIKGTAGVVKSETDEEKDVIKIGPGEYVKLQQGERHRLVGLDSYAILAEIWQHTDFDSPSDEDDIVRVQDDYGR